MQQEMNSKQHVENMKPKQCHFTNKIINAEQTINLRIFLHSIADRRSQIAVSQKAVLQSHTAINQ